MARPRLLVLSDALAPHSRRWATWFSRNGFEVRVASFAEQTLDGYDDVAVHRLWRHRAGNRPWERVGKAPILAARLRRLYADFRPDLVHAHSAGGYAWMAAVTAAKPLVITPWGTDLLVDVEKSRLNRSATRWALARADHVTTDGVHFIPILETLGVPASKILLHQFGTNTEFFSPGSSRPAGGQLTVTSTRTLTEVHDVGTFVRAMGRVHEVLPETRFVIAGDGPLRGELEAAVLRSGLGGQTEFTGMLDERGMRDLLRRTDVYVSTSKMDAGLAGSTGEAMASALPVVHTENSDNAHWTPEGVGGFLFPSGDDSALAACVIDLLRNAAMRARLGQANRDRVVRDYNVDVEMERVAELYLALMGRSA